MIAGFISEEQGQGAIEYILLAGGIIVSAVMIFGMYSKMNTTARNAVNESVDDASSTISSRISVEVANMA